MHELRRGERLFIIQLFSSQGRKDKGLVVSLPALLFIGDVSSSASRLSFTPDMLQKLGYVINLFQVQYRVMHLCRCLWR